MGNFEMRYPVHGSTALKPISAEQSQSATIIEFPAIAQNEFDWESFEQNGTAAQPSDFSQLKALFTTPLDDRKMVRSLKEGTLRGVSHSDMKPSHAIACGVAMTIASFILFFL